MSDSTLYSGRGGLECFRHLGVQDLGDGIGVPYGPPGSLLGATDLTLQIKSLNVDNLLLSLSSRRYCFTGLKI